MEGLPGVLALNVYKARLEKPAHPFGGVGVKTELAPFVHVPPASKKLPAFVGLVLNLQPGSCGGRESKFAE